jgi:hypothetical protein
MKLYAPMKIFRALNTCFQIYSYASLFAPTDDYRYKSIERRLLKKELGIKNVEDHHLIPQSLKNHPTLYDFDVHQCKNIKMMPGRDTTPPPGILKHRTHPKYNKYVLQCLDEIKQTDDERQLEIYLLLYHLDSNLNYEGDIPF